MAVNFPSGFTITTNEPIDNRMIMTKAEMLAVKKSRLPSVYFTICADDGDLYLYNSENEIDPETGRFRVLTASAPPIEENGIITIDQIKSLFQKEEETNGT